MRKLVVACVVVALAVGATASLGLATAIRPLGAAALTGLTPLARVTAAGRLRTPEVLQRMEQQVTLQGYYYDGSIPMVIDDYERIKSNMRIPDEAYVPLVGAPPTGVKNGDSIEVTGTLSRPSALDPRGVQAAAVVLRVADAQRIRVLQATSVASVARGLTTTVDRLGNITIRPGTLQPVASNKYAVLIAGGWDAGNSHIRYWNELKAMYDILKNRGYAAANITVIYADGAVRGSGMPVNYKASKANINTVFTQLASKVTASDTVYIMINDHGGGGPADTNGDETVTHHDEVVCLWGEEITDDEFAVQVNKLNASAKVIVQMEQCYSGGQTDDLTRPNRIIMSACSATEPSWGGADFNAFTYWYLAALTGSKPDGSGSVNADTNGDGKVSILEAYNFARANDSAGETPFYEDNGTLPAHSGAMPGGGEGSLGAATFLN
jgi:hypothetical protein